MDANDGGEEKLHSSSENDIFPKHVHYYLAIMAVSCYRCEYLLYTLQEQFLLGGGPLDWLIFGLDKVDPKIRRIAELNEVMAYKPWKICKDQFQKLIKGGTSQHENWTVHEVMKASIILATYHGICGLCQGMGVTPDIDIVQELLTLMGQEALELTISKEQAGAASSSYGHTATDCDADVSSYTSRSQRSDIVDKNTDDIYKYLCKTQAKKDQRKASGKEESSEESDSEKKNQRSSDGYRNSSGEEAEMENFQQDFGMLNMAEATGDSYSPDDLNIGRSKTVKKPKQMSHNPASTQHLNLEEVKVQEQADQLEEDDLPEYFAKHRARLIDGYKSFDHKTDKYLDNFEFSWAIHGYDIFSKFLPVTTELINQQAKFAYNMTMRSFADKEEKVDTSDFRNAIVFYLKEIHGIRDETFKYRKINDMFKIPQKVYIKKVMCNPQDITI